jgi:hypothetical protein
MQLVAYTVAAFTKLDKIAILRMEGGKKLR